MPSASHVVILRTRVPSTPLCLVIPPSIDAEHRISNLVILSNAKDLFLAVPTMLMRRSRAACHHRPP